MSSLMGRTTSALIGCALAATASLGAFGMEAQDRQQDIRQYRLGQQLGDCLVKGCVALLGTIASVGAPRQEPGEPDRERAVMYRDVRLSVTEWLHGKGESDDVQVLAASEPEHSKTGLGPWLAWEGVTLEPGAPLLVLRWTTDAPRPNWHGTWEDVALAVSDQRLFDPVRKAIDQHHRFQREPGEIAGAARLFQTSADVLFKAYVLTYLMDAASVDHLEVTAKVLAGLLGDRAVPAQGRAAIADWLGGSFYRLEDRARKAVTEVVVAAAAADDPAIADAALTVLVRVSDLDMLDMKAFLTPARQQTIATNYRAFQARTKAAQRHAAFESQLGLR
jgi:hypothetical protein